MAQHPNKLRWREFIPHGLSASQFGMALGFCGKVSDYIHYVRHVVGTELEFTGNSCTEHGIQTEPKSRALYEVLTGSRVHDGGFFLSHGGLLGCSPDGRIFLDDHLDSKKRIRHKAGSCEGAQADDLFKKSPQLGHLSFKVPFSRPPRNSLYVNPRESGTHPLPEQPNENKEEAPCINSSEVFTRTLWWSQQKRRRSRHRVRLLEIKSPVRQLYGGMGEHCRPFGIPLTYMCQMQGQMAIAEAEECDFFVFVDCSGQVEAWRVERSDAFWKWAEPKLLQVTTWLRDGPPEWLDRSFSFDAFDFSSLRVAPLIFPYSFQDASPLKNPMRFPYFNQLDSPYDEVRFGGINSTDTEMQSISKMVQSPVIRQLFLLPTGEEAMPSVQGDDPVLFYIVDWTAFHAALLDALKLNSLHGITVAIPEADMARVELLDVNTGRIHLTLYRNKEDVGSYAIHCYNRDVLCNLTEVY